MLNVATFHGHILKMLCLCSMPLFYDHCTSAL